MEQGGHPPPTETKSAGWRCPPLALLQQSEPATVFILAFGGSGATISLLLRGDAIRFIFQTGSKEGTRWASVF
jgi:hypothetical protein